MKTRNVYLTALLSAVVLTACGGGSSNDGPPEVRANAVPTTASVSVMSYFDFIGSLMASETATPLSTDDFTPPTSETALPSPVN